MKFIVGLLAALGLMALAPAAAHEFYFGADLSFADEMDDCGATFRDNGKPADVYAIFKNHGANLIRIRLWNNATWTKYSNLADVERSIKRAKAQGLQVLLDFHYSDDWADAGKQIIPAAWAGIKDETALAQSLYQYTFDTLTTLNQAGLMPDIVQVGNEINSEILMTEPWSKGKTINWARDAKLINAGIKAVRDAGAQSSVRPKVMLHIAEPENVEWWLGEAAKAGIKDFDLVGISYYTKWSKYTLAGLGGAINRLRHRYPGVGFLVAETAYPWTLQWADSSNNQLGEDSLISPYRATREGQAQYMIDLTQAVIANGGAGVLYWAPDHVSTDCRTRWGRGSDWENVTFFDFDGDVLPAIDFMRHQYSWPVTVTFRFHGLTPPAGQPFYLWGDFIGTNTFAVRLPDDGRPLTYSSTMMPGQKIRFQVFDNLSLHARLIAGDKVVDGFAVETVPNGDVVFDYALTMPAQ
jgi:arabinogalactan endo-1,4-beta-galactosidase